MSCGPCNLQWKNSEVQQSHWMSCGISSSYNPDHRSNHPRSAFVWGRLSGRVFKPTFTSSTNFESSGMSRILYFARKRAGLLNHCKDSFGRTHRLQLSVGAPSILFHKKTVYNDWNCYISTTSSILTFTALQASNLPYGDLEWDLREELSGWFARPHSLPINQTSWWLPAWEAWFQPKYQQGHSCFKTLPPHFTPKKNLNLRFESKIRCMYTCTS